HSQAPQQSFHQSSNQFQEPSPSQQTLSAQPAQAAFKPHADQSQLAPDAYAHASDLSFQTHAEPQFVDFESTPPPPPVAPAILAGAASCYNHAGMHPKFICRMCNATFCAECPKYVGGTKI